MNNRCRGRIKNLNRCSRHGPWKLFCDEHKYQWIKIFSFIVIVTTFLSDINPIVKNHFNQNKNFYGKWKESFEISMEKGTLYTTGEITYFKNGKYNYSGNYKIVTTDNENKQITANYKADATGDWIINDSTLTISLQDRKYSIKGVETGLGDAINNIVFTNLQSNKEIKKNALKGLSDQYQILTVSATSIELEGKTPDNAPFMIKMKRLY